jgi:hypothetical protein
MDISLKNDDVTDCSLRLMVKMGSNHFENDDFTSNFLWVSDHLKEGM